MKSNCILKLACKSKQVIALICKLILAQQRMSRGEMPDMFLLMTSHFMRSYLFTHLLGTPHPFVSMYRTHLKWVGLIMC